MQERARRTGTRLAHGVPAPFQRLYIIERQSGEIKIGISSRPRDRRSKLQSATPDKLSLVKTYRPPKGTAAQAEAAFKRTLAPLHIKGEWFSCSAAFAEIVVEAILEEDTAKRDFVTIYLPCLLTFQLVKASMKLGSENMELTAQWSALVRDVEQHHPSLLKRVMVIL